MKPAAFKATPQLSAEASRALLRAIGHIALTDKRRAELSELTEAARLAFARPLCFRCRPLRQRTLILVMPAM